jgi:ribonuclease P protein component
MIPKRHAKRSVTRAMFKRQIRAVASAYSGPLPAGLWLVRLHQGFEPARFLSASSTALRVLARQELQALFAQAGQRQLAAAGRAAGT